jgi:Outer membrane lipoprotein-sorting protein
MNRTRTCLRIGRRKAFAASIFSAIVAFVSAHSLGAATDDARSIMKSVYQQDTSHDATLRADFQVFDKNGTSTKKVFLYRRISVPGGSKILVVFNSPADVHGVALLSIAQTGVATAQYIYTPALHRVRDVAPQERSARFIGTDFTYEDISEHVLDDFTYKLVGDTETMEDHKTYKIQARPLDSQRSQYKFVYYWVAQDVPVILHAEMYDSQGTEVRTLHASDLKRSGGIWGARHVEMSSVQDGTRTVLTINEAKFNTGLDEKLFTPEALEGLQ